MPRHEDFEKIYQQMIEQYGEEKGKQVYYAWLKKMGYDDTKPMPKRESFSWTGSIKQIPGTSNLIRGQALHPIKTYHIDEWPNIRVYLEEELAKSAPTLRGKPLLLDHFKPLHGEVLNAEYEDGAIKYIAMLKDPDVLRMIENGDIRHCSVELEWHTLENVNGVAPRGIMFTGLSLLKDFEPGDRLSSVETWESIVQRLKEAKVKPAPPNPLAQKRSETEEKVKMLEEAVWGRAYINDLPDTAFAIVLPGGEKDEQGKTTPRTLRKFPHHRADGSLDPVHLRNANARLPQSDLTEEQKREAKAHLDRHKKALGIGEFAEARREPFKHSWVEQEEIEFEVAPEPTMDELIQSIEDLVEQINARLDALEQAIKPQLSEAEEYKKTVEALKARLKIAEDQKKILQKELQETKESTKPIIPSNVSPTPDMISRKEVVAKLEAIIPPPQIVFSHGQIGGFKRLVDNIKRVKREIQENPK